MDPDLVPYPTPHPTPSFRDLQKLFFGFPILFSCNLPTGTLFSDLKIKKILIKFCVNILFCKHYFRKGKDPEPDPDPVPGSPKTCGSGSPTLVIKYRYAGEGGLEMGNF
jgi:hypothetical protein